jgi:acyl carrier protein
MGPIAAEIRRFVVDNFLFEDPGDLTDTTSFLQTAVIDSTGILELVGFVESRFGISVEHHELVAANLDSIQRVAQFVRRKLLAREDSLAG